MAAYRVNRAGMTTRTRMVTVEGTDVKVASPVPVFEAELVDDSGLNSTILKTGWSQEDQAAMALAYVEGETVEA